MGGRGYPPTVRDPREPQPEVCDLCGTEVGARRLVTADVEGLRGRRICDTNPDCATFRSAIPWVDRRRRLSVPSPSGGARRIEGTSTTRVFIEEVE